MLPEEFTIELPEGLEGLESSQFLSPELLNEYQLAEERIFYVDSPVDKSLLEIQKQIICINIKDKGIKREERQPIKLCIFSYGGCVNLSYSLIDSILCSQTPVYTYNMGVAMSAGLLLLLAGEKRFATMRSRALIHTGFASAEGTYEQLREFQKDYDRLVDEMKQMILERTNISSQLYNRNKSKDWYIESAKQVELGIVDKIIESLDEIIG